MAEEKEEDGEKVTLRNMKSINANTQIVFTMKGFIATILTILGIFVGFHKMVIQPAIEEHKHNIEKYEESNEKKFDNINNRLIEITNGIGTINGNIEGINNRFKDLQVVRTEKGGTFN